MVLRKEFSDLVQTLNLEILRSLFYHLPNMKTVSSLELQQFEWPIQLHIHVDVQCANVPSKRSIQ